MSIRRSAWSRPPWPCRHPFSRYPLVTLAARSSITSCEAVSISERQARAESRTLDMVLWSTPRRSPEHRPQSSACRGPDSDAVTGVAACSLGFLPPCQCNVNLEFQRHYTSVPNSPFFVSCVRLRRAKALHPCVSGLSFAQWFTTPSQINCLGSACPLDLAIYRAP
jgi:hypothetical protein